MPGRRGRGRRPGPVAEDLGERTEMPTGRRLQEARHRGQVARSADLGSAIVLSGAAVLLVACGGGLIDAIAGVMRHALAGEGGPESIGVAGAAALTTTSFGRAAVGLAPVLLGLAL